MHRTYSTDALRAAYMPGRARMGRAEVAAVGLRYAGRRLVAIYFDRAGMVRYADKDGIFATFNKDTAVLED